MGPTWRRGRDSNPRYSFGPYTGLANQRLEPLGHLSTVLLRRAESGPFYDRGVRPVKERLPVYSPDAPVAQLDRAAAFEAAGRRFDSCQARHPLLRCAP